jgi:hypothetical protein
MSCFISLNRGRKTAENTQGFYTSGAEHSKQPKFFSFLRVLRELHGLFSGQQTHLAVAGKSAATIAIAKLVDAIFVRNCPRQAKLL